MLSIVREGETLSERTALLMGAFDGLHSGHISLYAAAQKTGLPVSVLTIAGGKAGGELFTREERRYVFDRVGVRYAVEYDFTPQMRATRAEDFLSELFGRICAGAVFCGEDFRFGAGAAGTMDMLRAMAPCPVTVLPLAREGGEKVSSSRIKQMLADADMGGANALLAVPYFICGKVEHGRHVGTLLGFPTVNLSLPAEKTLPKDGVYGGYAQTPAGDFPAIVNIGARPTFGICEKKIEAYLDGFSGDLYGETVRIYPTEYYRPIRAFASVGELKAQLARDIARLKDTERS